MKDVHRLSRLGVKLQDFLNGGFIVHNNFGSLFVGYVNSKQNLDTIDGVEGISSLQA